MASNKLRKASAPDEDEAKVDMSPMIDMVFLLLIFFIVNATAIIVQTDPKVLPPVAKNSKMQQERGGRIVINVWEDGTYTNEALENLADEAAMIDLVEEQRKEIENKGLEAKLHLRGDQNAVFKYSRTAIRAAAEAGVTEVVFAVYQTHKGLPAPAK
jgi:biopolymer transport protein ExbD